MRQAFKKYITPATYLHRWKKIRRSWKVSRLKKQKLIGSGFKPLWGVRLNSNGDPDTEKVIVNAFGIPAEKRIDWMKDMPGNHVFPSIRMDKLKMSAYYDRGIDVKYPWELSRFLFGNELAARYARSGKPENYTRFRELVIDWIENNPYCTGVNWACTMDVAIRATNWILAANVFAKEIARDQEFARLLSESLEQHGSYIHAFPEIYPGNHTTNHTTADFVGLLYVARALPGHPNSLKWQRSAVRGLISCIEYQVYGDGGSFEASAGYHRLVTELFGLGALVCSNHVIPLPESYYRTLHSMFGFLFSISDSNGNSPLFGDNDSGTLLQFNYKQNHNYSYMKGLYSILFSPETGSGLSDKEVSFLELMPSENLVHKGLPEAEGLKESENRLFKESGMMVFRRDNLCGSVHFMPIGQNGKGGHNHLDAGSFVLFYKGKPVVVDPGTYTYTRDVQQRNRFRDYSYHNTVIPSGIGDQDFNKDRLFGLDPYYKILGIQSESEQKFKVTFSLTNHPHPISREFLIEKCAVTIADSTQGHFSVKVHLAPGVKILDADAGLVRTNLFTLMFNPKRKYQVDPFDYAKSYQSKEPSLVLTIQAETDASMIFDFNHGK